MKSTLQVASTVVSNLNTALLQVTSPPSPVDLKKGEDREQASIHNDRMCYMSSAKA